MNDQPFRLVMAWCMEHPCYTFLMFIVLVLSTSAVVRCLFKALGGGYLPRKHCITCECEQAASNEPEE